MPDNVNNNESARKPARTFIPPFKTIIEDGTQEIKRQANALVEVTLDSTNAVDPKTLRKWGDDGALYFFSRLKARVSEQVGAAAATRVTASARNVAISAGPLSKATPIGAAPPASIKLSWKPASPNRAKMPVVTVEHWKARQRYRSSYVAAAIIHGLLHALILTIGAIILLRIMA